MAKQSRTIESLHSELCDDQYYYIQDSRSYHGNMVVWWAQDGNGYTSYIEKAWCLSGAEIKNRIWRSIEKFWKKEDVEKCISKHVDIQNLEKESKFI